MFLSRFISSLIGISVAVQASSPVSTHFSIAWSVVCLSVTLFRPFDTFGCHLGRTFVGSSDTLC